MQTLIYQIFETAGPGLSCFSGRKEPFNPSHLPENLPAEVLKQVMEDLKEGTMVSIETLHKVYNDDGNEVGVKEFNLRTQGQPAPIRCSICWGLSLMH
ncbi:MAG: hypothetical protein H6573_01630 [Lewinellaceae bacterium]|nr:hypothetical protein [Lewinellaceae bacterium]